MRIHFSFPNNCISYNCFSCNGTCCHVNNYLIINKEIREFIIKKYSELEMFICCRKDVDMLHCGKTCWFWEDGKGCNLAMKNIEKPITCKLFPLSITNWNNYVYVISFEPCPNFNEDERLDNLVTIKHEEVLKDIGDYTSLAKDFIKGKSYGEFKNARIFEEINYQNNLLSRIDELVLNVERKNFQKYVYLYNQLRWNRKILRLPIQRTENLFLIYCDLINKLAEEYKGFNRTNFYLILSAKFLKEVDDMLLAKR